MRWACLHAHTTASDGIFDPAEAVAAAAALGIRHLAITDHDSIQGYAAVRHVRSATRVWGGIEVTVSDPRFHASGHLTILFPRHIFTHVATLAARGRNTTTVEAWANLPVIALSGCKGSIVHRYGDEHLGRMSTVLQAWQQQFRDRLYFEVQASFVTAEMIEMARLLRLPVVATIDAHGTERLPYLDEAAVRAQHPALWWQQAVSRTQTVIDHLQQL